MWIADNWKDYEVIDCSKGEKLERWGDYILVRPDPQVIWDTPRNARGWKHMNGHYHRSKKGGGEWEFFSLPKQWQIHYGSLTFNLKPFSFKHTGLFPEQATNWDWFSKKIRNAGRPVKVLNLFAYTGGATLAAAAAGAHVTHVDASKGQIRRPSQRAHHIVERIPCLQLRHFERPGSNDLENDGDGPFFSVIIADGQGNPLPVLLRAHDDELPRQAGIRDASGLYVHQKDVGRKFLCS